MDFWLEFGKGTLFRLSFVIMILGLLRALILSLIGISSALNSTTDKTVPWSELFIKTVGWLFPIARLLKKRPVYSMISFFWHIGLILVPLFLGAHVLLFFGNSAGAEIWPVLSFKTAYWLSLSTIILGFALFLGRVTNRNSWFISRIQDIVWPILLSVVFLTGFLCANVSLSPSGYQTSMLLHVYLADLVMFMIPFTKVTHCILMPLSQFVSGVGWKFPSGAGEKIAKTLGKGEMPV